MTQKPSTATTMNHPTAAISPCCLTIAGSDSGGNAGVQADLRAFHAYGLHACTVFTALTAQNPFGVSAILPVSVDFLSAQLDAVLGVYAIRALKTGMMAEPQIIECVAGKLSRHPEIAKVIDPVMVATSGSKLVSDAAIGTLKAQLLPLARLVTPNLPEARELAGPKYANATAEELAKILHDDLGVAVLVKGGHDDGNEVTDILCDEAGEIARFGASRIEHPVSTHGTGCTLAAALAAELALGRNLPEAVKGAKEHVHKAISSSYLVGENCGVLGFVGR